MKKIELIYILLLIIVVSIICIISGYYIGYGIGITDKLQKQIQEPNYRSNVVYYKYSDVGTEGCYIK